MSLQCIVYIMMVSLCVFAFNTQTMYFLRFKYCMGGWEYFGALYNFACVDAHHRMGV